MDFRIFDSPIAIPKLKEFVLKIAFRGRLIPQVPIDEPASVLLERIRKYKERLIKENKIRKEKPLQPISKDETPYKIPESWEWVRMQEIFDVRDGTHDTPKYVKIGIPLVTSKNIYNGKLDLTNIKYISEKDHIEISKRSKVDKFDILFAMIGSIGNPVKIMIDPYFSIKNVALFKYYNSNLSCPDYLLYYLKYAENIMSKKSSGAVQAFVSLKYLRNFLFPLPPLSEQNRIVKKIDIIMEQLNLLKEKFNERDRIHDLFTTGVKQDILNNRKSNFFIKDFNNITKKLNDVKKLKDIILQIAVEGRIVPQDSKDEHASVLLEKIKKEKERLIKEKKIRKENPLPPISPDEILYDLPKGWEWTRLGDIGTINPRNQLEDNIFASFVPMAFISNLYGIHPSFEKRKWIEIKSGFTHFAENDVVIAKITPCFENSKAGIMRGLINGVGAGTTELHVFRGNTKYIVPEYVYLYLKTKNFLINGEKIMTGTVGQKRVPKSYISSNPFPFPPLKEQKRIVKKVDQLMQLCNQLEDNVKDYQKNSELLMDAVLKEAFEFN